MVLSLGRRVEVFMLGGKDSAGKGPEAILGFGAKGLGIGA
jgi:hypothetical protein